MVGLAGWFMSVQVGLCRVMSGQVGRKIFLAVFCRYGFASVFSVLAPTPGIGKFSTTHSDTRLTPTAWRLRGRVSCMDGSCRVRTGYVGSKRAMSGQVGQLYFFWTYALDCAQVSSLSLLAYGQIDCRRFTVLHGPSLACRFPASGRHGLRMKIHSQKCLFVFWRKAIISPFLMRLPCRTAELSGPASCSIGELSACARIRSPVDGLEPESEAGRL